MAPKWFLTSAYTIVFGNSADTSKIRSENITCPKGTTQAQDMAAANKHRAEKSATGFQVPLHYPRYKKQDYEKMEEWKVDMLLKEYGVNFTGTLDEKRKFAMGAFLWPDQL